jgi:hypothetical protein
MPHWLIKCALQHAVARLPRRHFWNGQLQRISGSLELSEPRFTEKLRESRRILDALKARGGNTKGFAALDLGTGWFPIIPLALHLCGARSVATFDIDPLLSPGRNAETAARFRSSHERGTLGEILPSLLPERLEHLLAQEGRAGRTTPAGWLAGFGIEVHVRDAQETQLAAGTVDLISSSGVLEYVPLAVLKGLFHEFRRVANTRSVMVHRLNLVDQYSYFDRRLTPWNFLRYSKRAWRWFDSPMISQNRLRACDYPRLLRAAGWKVVEEDPVRGDRAQLKAVPLHGDFKHYTEDELLVLHAWLTAVPDEN